MKNLNANEKPVDPRNENEEKFYSKIGEIDNGDVIKIWTRSEYMDNHWDIDENPIDPGFDYVARVSEKSKNGLYIGGSHYGYTLDNQKVTLIDTCI